MPAGKARRDSPHGRRGFTGSSSLGRGGFGASQQQCPMTQEESWRLRRRPAFVAGRFSGHRESGAHPRQPVLPAGEEEDGRCFRLGGENEALRRVAGVFVMLAARAGSGWRVFRLLRGASIGMRRGAATGQLFPRGFSEAAPAHRKSDAEAEEQCCQAGHHGVFGCRGRNGCSNGVAEV
jgi:hypothetical protein